MLKKSYLLALPVTLSFCAPVQSGDTYQTEVIMRGLERPTGIAAQGSSTLYITQLPTPGVGGGMGGHNTVDQIDLESGAIRNLTTGEPEPTNLALDKHGNLYWTCKSAGVILTRDTDGMVSLFLGDLAQPSGISVDQWDNVFFTLVPTPGVGGMAGGQNSVNAVTEDGIIEISAGEPEPTDIAVSKDGQAYWTCTSAGVILAGTLDGRMGLLLRDLESPTGIALDHKGEKLYWTEVPTPGVSGQNGGRNRVLELDLLTMTTTVVDFGDPEPTDITVARNGNLFWTCTSAGVIVRATRTGGR